MTISRLCGWAALAGLLLSGVAVAQPLPLLNSQFQPVPFGAANGAAALDSAGTLSANTVKATGGTTTATLAARAGDELNLKRDFGAAGDGVADDTAAVNAFFTACAAAPRACFAPAGTYMTGGITWNVQGTSLGSVVRGAGQGATIFKLIPGSAGALLTFLGASGNGFQSQPTLMDLSLNGNFSGTDGFSCPEAAVGGVFSQGLIMRRVTILNTARDGINIGTGCSAGSTDTVAVSHSGRNGYTVATSDWTNYGDEIYGNFAAGLKVRSITNNGSGLIRVHTDLATQFVTGQTASIMGSATANGLWTVTVVDSTDVDLQGSTFAHTEATGSWLAGVWSIAGIADNGLGAHVARVATSQPYNFAAGTQVLVQAAVGATVNGIWLITPIDATHFDLQGSSVNGGAYTGGGTVQAIAVGVDFIATGNITFTGSDIYDNGVGVDLSTSSGDPAVIVGGSIDSNFLGGVVINTNGVSVQHEFLGTRFVGNSSLVQGAAPDIYASNTGSTMLIGTHHVGNGTGTASYIVQTQGSLASPMTVVGLGVITAPGTPLSYTVAVTNDRADVPWPIGIWTVSTLPACNAIRQGQANVVTDATSPTFLGGLTGGGAVVTPVHCNGTAWVAG